MYEFKYDIKKREDGRPYIDLPKDFSDDPEHRFMVMEVTIFLLQDLQEKFGNKIDEQSENEFRFVIEFLSELSDNVAFLIAEGMDSIDEIKDILKNNDNEEE